ncbi:ATP-dependent RNA helicase HrpA [Propionibacterium sp.]|uniref:ATP-dependent RNA helicase HrpA n=1 Tax=Propionibacterium sp. TaxID=1977903 RepID=UPI0039EA9761
MTQDRATADVREPRIEYDPALPISAHVEQISELLEHHQVVVVAGETGSGKTTQIPKICLQLGRRSIGHTQPRRIAARTVAERLADEMAVPLGDVVGYQVRFTRQAGRQTRVKVMTDGVMLAEINHDRQLRRYDTIIIDEAHERSLNIDFLLGYLKQLLPARPDLKVIITSATIDTERFAEHFADPEGHPAPIVEVSGRTFPVEVRYRPIGGAEGDQADDQDVSAAIVSGLRELAGRGDVLVFLSGEREIREATRAIEGARFHDTEVVPLYARLSAAEQHRVFSSHTGRRVVLATNVAETSLTVPGIRCVIDTGLARISRYSSRTKVQRLPIEAISRASADQRAGRCGRVAPGVCLRLYSEEDYLARPEFTEPEILRTNLASVILRMAQAELGDIVTFPFVEPPEKAQVTDGIRLLDELGALKGGDRRRPRLTPVGRQLAALPIDPRLGRMLVEAGRLGCLREMEVIVASLAIQDVRERPADERQKADQLHRRFFHDAVLEPDSATVPSVTSNPAEPARYTVHEGRGGEFTKEPPDEGGDIWAIWRLWCYLHRQRKALSGNQFRRRCRREYLNYMRVREWSDLRAQLRRVDDDLKLPRNRQAATVDAVLTAVLAGLLSHVGLQEQEQPRTHDAHRGRRRRKGPREYLGARGSHFTIQPGSALASHGPELVMAVELVETSRLWARTCAEVQASWIEQVGAHLLKHNYSEPHWSSSTAGVLAYEKISLYGVPVISGRPIDFGRIDPVAARDIFIRSGLVEQAWVPDVRHGDHGFLDRNRRLIAQIEEMEERTRRRDLLVDDQTIFDFYDGRIPSQVHSGASFDAWWDHLDDHSLLDLHENDLVRDEAGGVEASDFPDHWEAGELSLPVSYVFEPGSGSDGVTVTVPLASLNQLSPQPFSWQVPGLRAELATELIRALPKSVRTSLVPAPDRAREALHWLRGHEPDHQAWFHEELGRALQAVTGVHVDPGDWAPGKVPGHLRVSFTVVGTKQTRTGKELAQLKQSLAQRVSQTLTREASARARTGFTDWSFGDIEATRRFTRKGVNAIGYPALRDDGDSVAIVVLDSPARQARSHALAVRRLLVLTNPDPSRWVVSHLGNQDKLWLGNSPYPGIGDLLVDARLKAVDRIAHSLTDPAQVRTHAQYDELALQVRQAQADRMRDVVATAAKALENLQRVRQGLPAAPAGAREDVTAQVENLVFPGFISFTRDPWYDHLPRYLAAAAQRLSAASANPAHDEQLQAGIDELAAEFDELCAQLPRGPLPDAVDDIGFLLEELRVQVFAQSLRTSVTVSAKRIRRAIAAAREQLN